MRFAHSIAIYILKLLLVHKFEFTNLQLRIEIRLWKFGI